MGTYLLKATDMELERWKAAARSDGMTFAGWLRHLAERRVQTGSERQEQVGLRPGNETRTLDPCSDGKPESPFRVSSQAKCLMFPRPGQKCDGCGKVHE